MTVQATFIEPDFTDPRLQSTTTYDMKIDGKDVGSRTGEMIEREAPGHMGVIVARYPLGTREDVNDAVTAAREAFDTGPWPRMPIGERSRIMLKVADLIERDAEELATIESLEVGKAIADARKDLNGCVELWRYAAGVARSMHGDVHTNLGDDLVGMVLREPVGVVGVITPWNFPLLIACERLPWILGMGCTAVVKPSEFTSGATLRLVDLLREAGVPDGAVNVVTGYGDPVGDEVTRNPGVDMVSFTGSLKVGRIVGAVAAESVKRVSLELGGKGPQIIFADADIDAAVDGAAFGVLFNNGQCCISGSRNIVERSIQDEFLSRLREVVGSVTFGDPLNDKTMVGSVINRSQIEKIDSYVAAGRDAGAEVETGGQRIAANKGLYFEPTVFSKVREDMSIAREEIFGPVLSVLSFEDPEEALRVANDSVYGLSGSVWTRDVGKAMSTIRRLRAGKTWVNGVIDSHVEMPLGGYKQSGLARETGRYGFDTYSEFKTVHLKYGERKMWASGRGR